jgi:hypothetical protein
MKRTPMLACFGLALSVVGCKDLGLAGNIPAEESRTMRPPELVAQVWAPVDAPAARIVVDGRLWVPTGQPVILPADALRPVGSAGGQTVYARPWDERPYGALFTAVPMPPAEAARSAREAMDAGRAHWQKYEPVIGQAGARGPAPPR